MIGGDLILELTVLGPGTTPTFHSTISFKFHIGVARK